MVGMYTEEIVVDLAHADIAYKQFDAWKGMGYNPYLSVTDKSARVAHCMAITTINHTGGDEKSNMAS